MLHYVAGREGGDSPTICCGQGGEFPQRRRRRRRRHRLFLAVRPLARRGRKRGRDRCETKGKRPGGGRKGTVFLLLLLLLISPPLPQPTRSVVVAAIALRSFLPAVGSVPFFPPLPKFCCCLVKVVEAEVGMGGGEHRQPIHPPERRRAQSLLSGAKSLPSAKIALWDPPAFVAFLVSHNGVYNILLLLGEGEGKETQSLFLFSLLCRVCPVDGPEAIKMDTAKGKERKEERKENVHWTAGPKVERPCVSSFFFPLFRHPCFLFFLPWFSGFPS